MIRKRRSISADVSKISTDPDAVVTIRVPAPDGATPATALRVPDWMTVERWVPTGDGYLIEVTIPVERITGMDPSRPIERA